MELLTAALLCNDASIRERDGTWTAVGDPMEAAIVAAGEKAGLNAAELRTARPRIDLIPFDATHRTMASLHTDIDNAAMVYVKGAPERLLELAGLQGRGGRRIPD